MCVCEVFLLNLFLLFSHIDIDSIIIILCHVFICLLSILSWIGS